MHMGWIWLGGSLKSYVSFAKKPYERDDILQKRPMILRSLLIVATPHDLLSLYKYTELVIDLMLWHPMHLMLWHMMTT